MMCPPAVQPVSGDEFLPEVLQGPTFVLPAADKYLKVFSSIIIDLLLDRVSGAPSTKGLGEAQAYQS